VQLLPGPCFGVELHGTLLQLSTVVSLMLDTGTNRPPGSTLPLQAMQPEQAAQLLTKFTLWKYYYHFTPLLIQLGNLDKRDVLRHNETAMQLAAGVAKAQLTHCVVGSMQDVNGTQLLLR
jgi:hypothetical protein